MGQGLYFSDEQIAVWVPIIRKMAAEFKLDSEISQTLCISQEMTNTHRSQDYRRWRSTKRLQSSSRSSYLVHV